VLQAPLLNGTGLEIALRASRLTPEAKQALLRFIMDLEGIEKLRTMAASPLDEEAQS